MLVIITGDHRGCDGTAFDEFAANHRLADTRFCRLYATHGVKTARAVQLNPVVGAYVGIAMALNTS